MILVCPDCKERLNVKLEKGSCFLYCSKCNKKFKLNVMPNEGVLLEDEK